MSSTLMMVFAFMTCTFALGLLMGWAVWRYGGVSKKAFDAMQSEVDFWKGSLENNRTELWNEQEKLGALQQETAKLKKRIASAKTPI